MLRIQYTEEEKRRNVDLGKIKRVLLSIFAFVLGLLVGYIVKHC